MMRSILFPAATIGLCGLLTLFAFQTADALKEEEREQVRKQISTVKTWQMTEELDLTEKQAQDLFPAQKSFEDKKGELTEQRLEVEAELTRLLEAKEKNRGLIKGKMAQLKKIDEQTRANEDRFHTKLSRILTVEQQAKYELFEKKFDERLRQMIRDIQKEDLQTKERSGSPRVEPGRESRDNAQKDNSRKDDAPEEKAKREPPDRSAKNQIQRREERQDDSGRTSSGSVGSKDSSRSRNGDRESEPQKKAPQKRESSQERSSRQQDEDEKRSSRSDNH